MQLLPKVVYDFANQVDRELNARLHQQYLDAFKQLKKAAQSELDKATTDSERREVQENLRTQNDEIYSVYGRKSGEVHDRIGQLLDKALDSGWETQEILGRLRTLREEELP